MPKFMIEYSPAQWNAPAGGVATSWATPYGGLHVQTPENLIGPSFTPAVNNFFFRNAELRTRPAFKQLLPGPDGANFILGCGSFLSRNQVWHTFCMTPRGLFQLKTNAFAETAAGRNPWVFLGGGPLGTAPVNWIVLNGILYYSNGGVHLSAWDGAASQAVRDVNFSGLNPSQPAGPGGQTASATVGAFFLGELDNHIITAYTNESVNGRRSITVGWSNSGFNPVASAITTLWASATAYGVGTRILDSNGNVQVAVLGGTSGGSQPVWNRDLNVTTADNTVLWANAGPNGGFPTNLGTIGATFDPGVSVNAGFNDFLDVPDIITGLMTLGREGFVFRQNGITHMTPTGKGVLPFDFNHMWSSQNGIGNVYPFTIAQYGNTGIFISFEQIYQITPGGLQPIGGGARDAIMTDLSNATGSPKASIDRGFNLGYTFLHYHLRIPLSNGTRSYIFSLEENNWTSWTETNVWPTGQSNECWV